MDLPSIFRFYQQGCLGLLERIGYFEQFSATRDNLIEYRCLVKSWEDYKYNGNAIRMMFYHTKLFKRD